MSPSSSAPEALRERLLNRELSWLDFNERVLAVAADEDVPLLERVRFCAIYSSNLDEFFMVRVAGLMGQAMSTGSSLSPDGMTAGETLSEIRSRALLAYKSQSQLWRNELQPALASQGILIGEVSECSQPELEELEVRFKQELYPVLTPLAVGPGQPFPYISGLSLSLGLFVRDPATGEERFARVKVPEGLPRFVTVGNRNLMVPSEEVIGHFLGYLFPGVEIVERTLFRVTRDADLEVDDDAGDLMQAVELELRRRRFGDVVRLEVSDTASPRMLDLLRESLDVTSDQVYPVDGLLDFADLTQLADLDRPDLKWEPWAPVTRPNLQGAGTSDFFSQIRRGDLLVHLPYDSFTTSVEDFVVGAARDQGVIALKATVYRTSEKSPVVPALIEAAEAGKQSVALVELKARFDERHNIEWSKRMERAGVHVIHGFPNLKIHAKTMLVVRREEDLLRRYVHIGTGNYHSATARIYEDFGLFTADPDIAEDVADLFNYLTGFSKPVRFRKILVAPFGLRSALKEQIRQVAKAAENKKTAVIRMKLNALNDPDMIDELYKASNAGVDIRILCRGICALRAGVPGLSKNITVKSVLGRFLEHSRMYSFQAGDTVSYYMGSADLMPRNLNDRVEVVVPIADEAIRKELSASFEAGWADDVFCWELQPDGHWSRIGTGRPGRLGSGSQEVLMKAARARAGHKRKGKKKK
ncbi:MAG TPA: polyphosphate kinase 1 [Actinomycetota bacterium]|nr:polyphosphate kinase 1 [Actinomycetota bacterium]